MLKRVYSPQVLFFVLFFGVPMCWGGESDADAGFSLQHWTSFSSHHLRKTIQASGNIVFWDNSSICYVDTQSVNDTVCIGNCEKYPRHRITKVATVLSQVPQALTIKSLDVAVMADFGKYLKGSICFAYQDTTLRTVPFRVSLLSRGTERETAKKGRSSGTPRVAARGYTKKTAPHRPLPDSENISEQTHRKNKPPDSGDEPTQMDSAESARDFSPEHDQVTDQHLEDSFSHDATATGGDIDVGRDETDRSSAVSAGNSFGLNEYNSHPGESPESHSQDSHEEQDDYGYESDNYHSNEYPESDQMRESFPQNDYNSPPRSDESFNFQQDAYESGFETPDQDFQPLDEEVYDMMQSED